MRCMTIEQFRKMLQSAPFRPFDIHLADGRKLTVRHPENVALSPGGRTAIVADTEETFEVVDLLLVTSLRSQTNGKKRKPPNRKRR